MHGFGALWERQFRLNVSGIAVAVAAAWRLGKVARCDSLTRDGRLRAGRCVLCPGVGTFFLTGSMPMKTRGCPGQTRWGWLVGSRKCLLHRVLR